MLLDFFTVGYIIGTPPGKIGKKQGLGMPTEDARYVRRLTDHIYSLMPESQKRRNQVFNEVWRRIHPYRPRWLMAALVAVACGTSGAVLSSMIPDPEIEVELAQSLDGRLMLRITRDVDGIVTTLWYKTLTVTQAKALRADPDWRATALREFNDAAHASPSSVGRGSAAPGPALPAKRAGYVGRRLHKSNPG
jgi:hypothetical protein